MVKKSDEFKPVDDGLFVPVSDPGPAARESENRVNVDGQPRVPGNLPHSTGNVSSNQPEIFSGEPRPLTNEQKKELEEKGTPRGMAINEHTRTPLGQLDSQQALDMNRGLATGKTIPEGTLEEAVRDDKAPQLEEYKRMLVEANKALGNAKIGEISLQHPFWGLSDAARRYAKDQGILK